MNIQLSVDLYWITLLDIDMKLVINRNLASQHQDTVRIAPDTQNKVTKLLFYECPCSLNDDIHLIPYPSYLSYLWCIQSTKYLNSMHSFVYFYAHTVCQKLSFLFVHSTAKSNKQRNAIKVCLCALCILCCVKMINSFNPICRNYDDFTKQALTTPLNSEYFVLFWWCCHLHIWHMTNFRSYTQVLQGMK